MREAELLRRLRAIFDIHPPHDDLVVGNGDDGAVIAPENRKVVLATDVAVEGVHFRLDWSTPAEVGRKITAANLADICAMGGWPHHLLVSAVIPPSKIALVEELARGIATEAAKVGAAVIGGDLSTGSEIAISITAIGYVTQPITRAGAQVGDLVLVSHMPGWSAAGLELLSRGISDDSDASHRAISAHKAPEIPYLRYRESFAHLHSATDISDGLLVDASHIADASDVTIDLSSQALHDKDLESIQTLSRDQILRCILSGGEDHVLLVTAKDSISGFHEVGRVVARGESAVLLDGAAVDIAGFQHGWNQ